MARPNPSATSVVLASGGIDSTAAIAQQINLGRHVVALTINYGQRHTAELDAVIRIVQWYQHNSFFNDVRHENVNLPGLGAVLDSTLTRPDRPVPEGHYAAPSMAETIVPNRNMILLSIAAGLAESIGSDRVVIGCHSGDHHIYPDCRPEFIRAAYMCVEAATNGKVQIIAPFVNDSKADIVSLSNALGAPLDLTWSCYQTPDGRRQHCGVCGTCNERKEAFILARVPDPTKYAR